MDYLIEKIKLSLAIQIKYCGALIKTDFSEINEIHNVKSYIDSILYNLISNSIKYRNPEKQPEIFIKSSLKEDKIEIMVKDNGIGMDLNIYKEKVFMLYQRFHLDIEGKGMGLYLVKSQIEALGGSIEVESEVNIGTSFYIHLPV